MNLLVTGGAGFLGSHFVRTVLADAMPGLEGARITVLDKLTYAGSFASLAAVAEHKRLDFVPGDVCDVALVESVVPGHDAVVHFAAETHAPRFATAGGHFATSNVLGTQVLLDAAMRHAVDRFVQVSTADVYGTTGTWTEDAPLAPVSAYAATKAGADLLALAYARDHGAPVVVTRGAATYGPYQHPEKPVPALTTALLRNVVAVGPDAGLSGDRTRSWVHVDDHCRAVTSVLLDGRVGAVYHVAGDADLSDGEVADVLRDAAGRQRSTATPVPGGAATPVPGGAAGAVSGPGPATVGGRGDAGRSAGPNVGGRRCVLDDALIRRELGYKPRVVLRDGLADTVRWYRDNRRWWAPLMPG